MKKLAVLIPFSVMFLAGCHHWGGGIRIEGGQPHRQVEQMPPAHAPAHGRRRQVYYRYYYYPEAEFYFDMGRGLYFYLDSAGRWSFSANLPRHLRTYRHSRHVEIKMESDRPYSKHREHQRKFKKHNKPYKRGKPDKYGKPDKRGKSDKYGKPGKRGKPDKDEDKKKYDDDDERGKNWRR